LTVVYPTYLTLRSTESPLSILLAPLVKPSKEVVERVIENLMRWQSANPLSTTTNMAPYHNALLPTASSSICGVSSTTTSAFQASSQCLQCFPSLTTPSSAGWTVAATEDVPLSNTTLPLLFVMLSHAKRYKYKCMDSYGLIRSLRLTLKADANSISKPYP
jgi:hypothetical protein